MPFLDPPAEGFLFYACDHCGEHVVVAPDEVIETMETGQLVTGRDLSDDPRGLPPHVWCARCTDLLFRGRRR